MNFYEIEKKIDKIEEKLKSLHERDDIDKEKLKAIEEKFKRKIEKFYSNLTPYQKVLLARHPNRPKFLDYVN
ncbi:MAG TPA: acetyl-CoA carboxylase carboxyl transferase subunit alpha, partial [Aquificae bacterium]|nr:acetyl-CoA carboxylase carboxyl transferase subunit alpha [Aquificota bacterium]